MVEEGVSKQLRAVQRAEAPAPSLPQTLEPELTVIEPRRRKELGDL